MIILFLNGPNVFVKILAVISFTKTMFSQRHQTESCLKKKSGKMEFLTMFFMAQLTP